MPRQKKFNIEYRDTFAENMLKLVDQTNALKSEFYEEIAQAPLLCYYFKDAGNAGNYFIIALLRRFAVALMYFYDKDNDGVWPTMPNYDGPEVNDVVYMFFSRTDNSAILREFEQNDMDIIIKEEGVIGSALQKYIDSIYYDRKHREWIGWSMCSESNPFNLPSAFPPEDTLDNYVSIANLTTAPDCWVAFNTGEATYEDLFQFWLKTKKIFEIIQLDAFQVEIVQPDQPSEYELLKAEQQTEYEEQYVQGYREIAVIQMSMRQFNSMYKQWENDTVYQVTDYFGYDFWYLIQNNAKNEIQIPVVNQNGKVYVKDIKYKGGNLAYNGESWSESMWPFDPQIATAYFGNTGWFTPATFEFWELSIELFKEFGVLVGSVQAPIHDGMRASFYSVERTPIILMQPQQAFGRKDVEKLGAPQIKSIEELYPQIVRKLVKYTRRFMSQSIKRVAFVKDRKFVTVAVSYAEKDEPVLWTGKKQYYANIDAFINAKDNQILRSQFTQMLGYLGLRAISIAVFKGIGKIYVPSAMSEASGWLYS